MTRKIVTILGLAVLALYLAAPAMADTVSSSDGFGGTFTLTTNCVGSICDVQLQIDTTSSTEPNIDAVAFKLGNGTNTLGTITGAPDSPGNWAGVFSSLNSGGVGPVCTGNGDQQNCYYADGGSVGTQTIGVATGGILTWTWTGIDTGSGGTDIGHVGYQYNTGAGTRFNGLIVSCGFTNDVSTDCGGTSVPEPGSLSMLGAGLLGLVGFARRRFLNI